MVEKFNVTISRGDSLAGYFWKAENAAFNLIVSTGMDEYAGRYARFASYLNEHGVNVWVLDAYGQGLNAASAEEQERWPKDAFRKQVDAIYTLISDAKENGLPTAAMGHSMGSFLIQSLIQRYPGCADGVIICGSNGGQAFLMTAGYGIAKLTVNEKNWDSPNPTLQNLGLGGYTKAIKDRKTDFDWLSFNEENVRAYIADPFCGHENTGGFWLEFLRGMSVLWKKKSLANVSPDERILIISGTEDPVGRNGEGPKWLEATYRQLGVKDVKLILYPDMRHEILNEDDREKVFQDILAFISSSLS